jgi:hypothetical protein
MVKATKRRERERQRNRKPDIRITISCDRERGILNRPITCGEGEAEYD